MMRRRGFSLIEVTVFAGVGLIVMAGVWAIFNSSIRRGKATDAKVQGLQAVLLLARTIERDMALLYENQGVAPGAFKDIVQYREEPGVGTTLWLSRYHPDPGRDPGATWGKLPLQRVRYRFDATTKHVFRSVDGGPERALFGLFETVRFRGSQQDLLPPYIPIPGDPLIPSPAYEFCIVSTPEDVLEMTLEERDEKRPRSRTTLVGAVPRERETVQRLYPYWNNVPYLPEAPPEE
jgi:hypothetical protein